VPPAATPILRAPHSSHSEGRRLWAGAAAAMKVFHRSAGRFLAHAFRHRMKAAAPSEFAECWAMTGDRVYRRRGVASCEPGVGVLLLHTERVRTRRSLRPCSKFSGDGLWGLDSFIRLFYLSPPTSCSTGAARARTLLLEPRAGV